MRLLQQLFGTLAKLLASQTSSVVDLKMLICRKSSFDIVTMWDVIDHILRPDPLLKRCHALLREGGICFIRTSNIFNQLLRARLKKLVWGMQPGVTYLQARDHAPSLLDVQYP